MRVSRGSVRSSTIHCKSFQLTNESSSRRHGCTFASKLGTNLYTNTLKYWFVADPTGYTLNFDLYCDKQRTVILSWCMVRCCHRADKAVPFSRLPCLLWQFLHQARGQNTSSSVESLRHTQKNRLLYLRKKFQWCVCLLVGQKCVTVLSNNYPGNGDGTATRYTKDRAGRYSQIYVPLPADIKYYNQYMGGVNTSDQIIGYLHIVRQMKRYWKTLFYRLHEVSKTNYTSMIQVVIDGVRNQSFHRKQV